MKKISKKDFMELHKTGKLNLVQSIFNKTKEEVKERIEKHPGKLYGSKTSRIDLSNNGEIEKITVYFERINDQDFYFVESVIDSSKDSSCSWNDIQYNTILYVKREN